MNVSPSLAPPAPAVIQLVRPFPLPAAVLHLDGRVGFVNDRLAACFGAGCLASAGLREVISRSVPIWRPLRLRRITGEDVDVLAQSKRHASHVTLVIDDMIGGVHPRDVNRLWHALRQLDGRDADDFDAHPDSEDNSRLDRLLDAEMTRSGRFKQPLSILLVGVDRFGQVNGAFGREAADRALGHVLRTLRGSIRMADLLLSWGGDRFVVLTPATDFRHAQALATGLRIMVERCDFGAVGHMTVSVGVAEALDGESKQSLLARADRALREAKDAGRNQVVVDERGRGDAWMASGETLPPYLVWQDRYECGDHAIDAQHRALFELTNELIDATAGGVVKALHAGQTVERLLAHVSAHFADEERFLDSIGYPFVLAHKLAHRDLLQRATWLAEQASVPGQGYGAIVEFLKSDVVAKHVFDCDSDFFELTRRKRRGDLAESPGVA
jgi:diguanylate cyclase (GGDEF)-like protein/hemerythrin-like metal-binding protein